MRIQFYILAAAVCAGAAAQEPFFFAQAPGADAARAARDARRATEREEPNYRSGTRAIDKRDYEAAIQSFDQVVAAKGNRADGALYWKAYAQNKLGRRDQALSTLAQLQKEYPQSRWTNDAKALEVEVKQASGQPVSPDAESDEDLKLLAINGLMSSDPERAVPLLQKVLADPKASPKVKERALFVVAQSREPQARDVLLKIAKGGGNPDMQLKAVEYLSVFSKGNTQALADIYASTNDPAVKRAVIHGLMVARDAERLMSVAKTEQSPELRREAIQMLGTMKRDQTGDALVSMYASETNRDVKRAIIDGLFIQQNAKALIDLARKETDPSVKKELVQRLSVMRTKEATDYMMEVLSK
jgi:HEAT repeat protein